MTTLLRSESSRPERDVLVFGSGAIGGAIVRHLLRRRAFSPQTFVVPWSDPRARVEALSDVALEVQRRAPERPVSVIWAAGRAGFSATEAEAADELLAYRNVIDLVKRLHQASGGMPHAFHLISSAGGLYEGRAVRAPSEAPAPLRSYGRLKLAQEQHAVTELSGTGVAVYRPSSVYTAPGRGARIGLIGVLVNNGMAQRPTTIVGALDTLRDYVMAADVATYVAESALRDVEHDDTPHMLVSGEPASILQVVTIVEAVVRRRLYVRVAESWNAHNITFSPAVKADRFRTTQLSVGARMVYSAALGSALAG